MADHGEVFTAEREVNAMLDLVQNETARIESRFLEPACGNGNFLIEVLRRKLDVVESRYKKSQLEYERYAVIAMSSLYGVDILEDNVIHCRERLYDYFSERYTRHFKNDCKEECQKSVKIILERNILWGDALTMKTVCGKQDPIVFSEWSAVNGSMIKRRDYSLANLLAYQPMGADTLFSDLNQPAIIPTPLREFPLMHFLKLDEYA